MLWLGVQLGLVDEVEDRRDPRQALDLAYARQLELQSRARQAVADVVAARKRIELQTRHLGPAVARLEERTRTALESGRQEEAREALTWRTTLQAELTELEGRIASLAGEESRLRQAASRLDLRVRQLRLRRDALRASHAAARARVDVEKALAEVRLGDSELMLAVQEAEQLVARTRALADAFHGQAARRALAAPDAEAPGAPDARPGEPEVADELARMEEELLWGPQAGEELGRQDEPGR